MNHVDEQSVASGESEQSRYGQGQGQVFSDVDEITNTISNQHETKPREERVVI